MVRDQDRTKIAHLQRQHILGAHVSCSPVILPDKEAQDGSGELGPDFSRMTDQLHRELPRMAQLRCLKRSDLFSRWCF